MTKRQLEKRYGVHIDWDDWNSEYKIYAADDCLWEKGFTTLKACEKECKEWAKELISIKKRVEENRREALKCEEAMRQEDLMRWEAQG